MERSPRRLQLPNPQIFGIFILPQSKTLKHARPLPIRKLATKTKKAPTTTLSSLHQKANSLSSQGLELVERGHPQKLKIPTHTVPHFQELLHIWPISLYWRWMILISGLPNSPLGFSSKTNPGWGQLGFQASSQMVFWEIS